MSTLFDLSIQIWPEDGVFYYSVIQEFTEEGNDSWIEPERTQEVLGYGTEDTREEAAKIVKDLVDKALS